MNPVLNALQFRHACKKFDPERRIPEQTLREILECARLSPSSFGLEPWKFLVLQDMELRRRLRPACWNQPQITESSAVVAILARNATLEADSAYVRACYDRRGLPEEKITASLRRYGDHLENEVKPLMSLYAWASKQCYIALADIMTAAAAAGVDSCPIEGFEKAAVERVLGLPEDDFQVAVLVALGYRAGDQTPRFRHDFDRIIEFR
ncbi:MAG TPA: NAD(P)H-dependent oxidoreductase [Sedimenticola thiotaurini]|uniref:NAD(P)H-dependent oxidoreductase n=1 Tax=Sedimenticola thiotaurini TaxID=1543721 RepID=A0A831RR92_9GAMM|nr:NAD(P)H-dependent oxidoreductase [Sedimenticola thiotaurini]